MDLKNTLFLLLLLISTIFQSQAYPNRSKPIRFIQSSCRTARYQSVCIRTLSPFATKIHNNNDHDLARIALTISLVRARSATTFITELTKGKRTTKIKRKEYLAMKDCIEVLDQSVDHLYDSIKELGRLGQTNPTKSLMWKISNVQTWTSAAITEQTTCLDGFSEIATEGYVKRLVRAKVVNVVQVTSNALALVNQFAKKCNAKNP